MTKVRRILVALLICSVAFTVGGYFDADESGTAAYGANPISSSQLEERTISAEVGSNTVEVTAPVTDDVTVEATEIQEKAKGYKNYVNQAAQVMNMNASEFTFARVLDITPIDLATGEEFQPDGSAKVSVKLADEKIGKNEEVAVLHFTDAAASDAAKAGAASDTAKAGTASGTTQTADPSATTPEVIESEVNGRTVEFETDGFSVFVLVGYTVDFHWGEYTYNLAGGSEIFLSELLPILAENGTGAAAGETGENNSASQTEKLNKVAKDMSLVKSVTFSDPELVQVDEVEILDGKSELIEDENSEKLVEHTRKDWRLWSLQPFHTEEKLTITLTDGEKIEVFVTDEVVDGDAAGGSTALPRVTADGVTYVLHSTPSRYADVYAISAGSVIHETIKFNNINYPTMDIRQTEGNLTKKPTDMDIDLVIRAAENYSFELPDIKTDISDEEKQDLSDEGYTEGTDNDGPYKVWKKAEYDPATNSIDYTMKYFQAMKDDSKIDFIFIYDDSASMYSGTRTTQTGVSLREAQTTRVVILDAVNALLPRGGASQKENYDINVYLGGASTGHTTMEGPFTTYEQVATSLSTYRTGATKHDTGVANALAAAKASKKAGRQPVVVYLSDFHQPGSLTNNSSNLTALHNIALVYGLSTDYRYGVNRPAKDIPSGASFMHKMNDIKGGVEELEKIILEAIGYYIKDKVTVTDNLSDALKGNGVSAGTADGGSAPAGTGKSVWSIGGSTTNADGDTVYSEGAGKIYTENFSVQLDDSTVYAGAMPTNASATVEVGGEKVNGVDSRNLKLSKELMFVLGEMDEKDRTVEASDKTPATKINGIKFELTEADGNGNPKTDATVHRYTTETVDGVDGVLRVPFKEGTGDAETVVLELGKNYVLEEVSTSVESHNNTTDGNDLKAPDKSWLIKVAANGVITTEVNGAAGQTPAMTVAPAAGGKAPRFVIWNQIEVEARLIPITVKKVWPDTVHPHDPVRFTVYGVDPDDPDNKFALTAYSENDSESTQVRYLEGSQNETTWSKVVYVPELIVENEGTEDEKTYSFYEDDSYTKARLDQDFGENTIFYVNGDSDHPVNGTEDLVDSIGANGEITYNQNYSYEIREEAGRAYKDGWYDASYESSTSATAAVTTYVPSGQNEWVGMSGSDISSNFRFFLNIYGYYHRGPTMQQFIDDYSAGTASSGAYLYNKTAMKNFFEKLQTMTVVVTDSNQNPAKKYQFVITPGEGYTPTVDWTYSAATGGAIFNINAPALWSSYNTISGSNFIRNLHIDSIEITNTEGHTYQIYEPQNGSTWGGTSTGATTYNGYPNPSSPGNNNTTKYATQFSKSGGSYGTNAKTNTDTSNTVSEWSWVGPPTDTTEDAFSVNSGTLTITNSWQPNALTEFQADKKWVNSEGGAIPAAQRKSSIELAVQGVSSGGKKPVEVLTAGSSTNVDTNDWTQFTTVADPDAASEEDRKVSMTGDPSAAEWTSTYYVPTHDLPGSFTWDAETGTGTADEFTSYTLDETPLTAAEEPGAAGTPGEWDEPDVDFEDAVEETEEINIPGGWNTYTPESVVTKYLKINTNGGTVYYVRGVRVTFEKGGKTYKVTVASSDTTSNQFNGTRYIPFTVDSEIDGATITKKEYRSSNWYENGSSGNYDVEVVNSANGTSYNLPRDAVTTHEKYIDGQYTPGQEGHPATFTITNTFTPNVPVELKSEFTDTTEDKASTGLISSVVYTIAGTTTSGEDYSRVVKTSAEPTSGGDENTVISSLGRTVYVPKGTYTIEQTAYTLDGSTQYATKAYKTTYGSSETEGIKQTVTLDNTATATNVSFDNVRKDLPIKVRTLFEPELTDEEAANTATRPMKDRQFTYEFIYTDGNGGEHELNDAAYLLDDSKFNNTAKNYVNEHPDAHIPSYSVRGILTECDISGSGIEDALPDYMTTVSSEEKDGKLIFTVAASIKRAQIIVQKSWDGDIAAEDRQGITLKFSIRRSDDENIYGTDEQDCDLTIETNDDGEATGEFILGKDDEQTDIYLPILRQDEVAAGVKYILTETSASKGLLEKTYYVTFGDLTKKAENKFKQTNPLGKNVPVGDDPANEAKFVLTKAGIIINVTNASGPYICKIDDGQEHPFRTLNKAVEYARTYLRGEAMIEMLVDYEIPKADKVTLNQNKDKIIITTAATSGGEYNFNPTFTQRQGRATTNGLDGEGSIVTPKDNPEIAILKRSWDGAGTTDQAMFYINNSTAALTTQNILFDGESASVNELTGELAQRTGRAIYVANGSLTVKDGSTFRNFSTPGTGGAIYTAITTLKVQGTTPSSVLFENCRTTGSGNGGGAIDIRGGTSDAIVKGATFIDCYASGNGGSIFINISGGKVATIENCVFDGHEKLAVGTKNANVGGAIYEYDGSMTIIDCSFTDLTATGVGGAIRMDGGGGDTLRLTGITVNGHVTLPADTVNASSGGGISINASSGTYFNGITVTNCRASGAGGGINTSVVKDISGECKFSNCYANGGDGGGVLFSTVTIGESARFIFDNCHASGNGGGIYFGVYIPQIKESKFTDCSAGGLGGSVYLRGGGSGSIEKLISCEFNGHDNDLAAATLNSNSGAKGGGGIYVYDGSLELTDCTFTNLTAKTNGGAVLMDGGGGDYLSLTNCTIDGNDGKLTQDGVTVNNASAGGGIWINADTGTKLNDVTIKNCQASGNGGGIYDEDKFTETTEPVLFENCYTTGGNGGGAYFASTATFGKTGTTDNTVTFKGCHDDSTSTANGGGGAWFNSTLTLQTGTKLDFDSCHAASYGGGAWFNAATTLNAGTVNFKDCYAEMRGGGAYFANTATLNNTVSFEKCHTDTTSDGGGGAYFANSATLKGTVSFEDCYTKANGGAMYLAAGGTLNNVQVNGHKNLAAATTNAVKGGAFYLPDSKAVTLHGGEYKNCSASDANGGAVNVGGVESVLNFEADVVVYNNPQTAAEGVQQKNVVLDCDANTVIKTTGTALSQDAHIGIYVPDGTSLYDKHGKIPLQFGTKNTSNANLDRFTNDRDESLFGTEHLDTGIYWGRYICKVVDTDTDKAEHIFTTLMGAVKYARANRSKAFAEDGFCTVQMLVDYTVFSFDVVTLNTANDKFVFTTAKTQSEAEEAGEEYYFTDTLENKTEADTGISILTRGWNGNNTKAQSLFYVTNGSATLSTTKLIMDGKNGSTQQTGRAICVNAGNLSISTGSIFRNFYINGGNSSEPGDGGAIYIPGTGTSVIDEASFIDCHTESSNGGSIYSKASTLTLDSVTINGHTEGGLSPSTKNANLGGAIYAEGNVTIKDGEIKNCSASNANGGAINVNGVKAVSFEGSAVVHGNGTMDSSGNITKQKNMVLQQDNNTVIRTTPAGLNPDAYIGVYVIDGANYFNKHGQFEQDFGTIGEKTETTTDPDTGEVTTVNLRGDKNLDCFINDRNGLYGEPCPVSGHSSLIRWTSYLCKLTDADGNLLYMRTGSAEGGYHYRPAVYKTFATAFQDLTEGPLYQDNEGTVAYQGTADISVELLKNYVQPSTDTASNSASRKVTLKTASKTASGSDVYIYNPGSDAGVDKTYATVKRGYTGDSMFTMNSSHGELTVTGVILDGNKDTVDPASDDTPKAKYASTENGGIIKVSSGKLNIRENATLRNSVTSRNGGAVYVASGAKMTMTAGTITGNAAANGAGIYLKEGSELQLSGSPGFGGTDARNGNHLTADDKRQDIYIEGYLGTKGGSGEDKDDPKLAESIVVTGALNLDKGSIWVGAEQQENEDNNHWDSLKQFAMFADDLMEDGDVNLSDADLAKTVAAFRNASLTEYYGVTGENLQCIYWDGVRGSRKVILRKVATGSYKSLQGARFEIHQGSESGPLISGTDINGTETNSFVSGDSGVFYAGILNYGEYYIVETTTPSGYKTPARPFKVTVNADGVGYLGTDGKFDQEVKE